VSRVHFRVVPTKVIAIQVDDLTYERLSQIALAKGVSLSEYARSKLDIEDVRKAPQDQMDEKVHNLTMQKLKKEAEDERGTQYHFDLKVHKTVGKRVRVYWRTKPLTDYDAIVKGAPDKVGMWELTLSRETTHPFPGAPSGTHRGGDYYMEKEERKYYYKRRGLYKAINSLCRHYGQPPLYREGAKVSEVQSGPTEDTPE